MATEQESEEDADVEEDSDDADEGLHRRRNRLHARAFKGFWVLGFGYVLCCVFFI